MSHTIPTRITAVAIALLAALALSLAGSPTAPMASAEASTVKGKVFFYNGTNGGVASLTLQRYTSSGWVNLKTGTSTSAGDFACTLVGGGYYYRVRAARSTGACYVGIGIDYWLGTSAYVYTPSNHVVVTNPYMYWQNHLYC